LEEEDTYIDPTVEFEDILKSMIVEPFGERLNQELLDIFGDIDFSGNIIAEVRKLNKRTPRRFSRKPQTPSKLSKEEVRPGSQSRSASKIRDHKNICESST